MDIVRRPLIAAAMAGILCGCTSPQGIGVGVAPEQRPDRLRLCSLAAPESFGAESRLIAAISATGAAQVRAGSTDAKGESSALLEHIQTVNLLRESMYRTCERWLSGALTKEEFMVQSARDHRTMIAVLAIEQLTGEASHADQASPDQP